MKQQLILMGINVVLAALAAFMGALTYAQVVDGTVQYDKALLATAGYAGLRAAIGLGSEYASYLARKMQAQVVLEDEA